MFVSTFELICLAASNSHAVFCFCNLIIAILVVGSSMSASQCNEEKPYPCHSFPYENKDSTNMKNAASSSMKAKKLVETDEDEASSISITSVNNEERTWVEEEEEEEASSSVGITMVNDEEKSRDEEQDDDDELRRRVEEFIEKVNKGWMDEKLKTYCLVQ
ncbi:unnamed protein product [Fraxinus pennsylvanica]|uniref:Uncharacterized protein n=1 Tax=Fraxinus pennsylvanica TaxID=56036 RepID=A0AAD1ZXB9_9LAMI|nr:unnamed protein product [Fraxinus pennsylvanica]